MDSSFKWSFFGALLLHVSLLFFLLAKFNPVSHYTQYSPKVSIIKATAVSNRAVVKQLTAIRRIAAQKRAAKLAKIRRQQAKILAIKRARILRQRQRELAKRRALVLAKERRMRRQRELALARQKRAKALEEKRKQKILAAKRQKFAIQKEIKQEIAFEAKQRAAVHARAVQNAVDKYKAMIIQVIAQSWVVPPSLQKGLACQLLINVIPGGTVAAVTILKSSGDAVLDRSAQTAVWKSSPLPVPSSPELFDNFSSLRLTVRPEQSSGWSYE